MWVVFVLVAKTFPSPFGFVNRKSFSMFSFRLLLLFFLCVLFVFAVYQWEKSTFFGTRGRRKFRSEWWGLKNGMGNSLQLIMRVSPVSTDRSRNRNRNEDRGIICVLFSGHLGDCSVRLIYQTEIEKEKYKLDKGKIKFDLLIFFK